MSLNNPEIKEYKSWHKNGQLLSQEFYKKGKLEGRQKMWDNNGILQSRRFYQNGKSEGKNELWYANKQLGIEEYHRNGKLEGERKLWHSDGSQISHSYWKNGTKIDPEFTQRKKHSFIVVKFRLYGSLISQKRLLLDFILIADLSNII